MIPEEIKTSPVKLLYLGEVQRSQEKKDSFTSGFLVGFGWCRFFGWFWGVFSGGFAGGV